MRASRWDGELDPVLGRRHRRGLQHDRVGSASEPGHVQVAVEDTTTRAVELRRGGGGDLASNAARPAGSVACKRALAAADISGGVQSVVL
jgi:hypothetical protein